MDGSIQFAKWRQWRIRLICASFGPPTTKWQIDRFSRFCTAHGRYFTMGTPFLKNCPFPWEDLDRHLTHDSLGPSKSITQMASPLPFLPFQPFLHRWPQSVPLVYNGMPFPPKISPFHGGSGPQSNTWFPGPPESSTRTASEISIGSAVFAVLTSVTDRQTNRQIDWQTTLLGP